MQRPLRDATIQEIEDELARRDLLAFTLRTKPNYNAGWFHRKVAEALDQFVDDVIAKRSPRLILTAPPQHGKSELTSRRMPAFALGRNPDLRIGGTAYSPELAESFSIDVQRIIDSAEYSSIFPNTRILAENTKSVNDKRSTKEFSVVGHQGSYRAAGRGTPLTGRSLEILIIDDPLKDFEEAMSETIREATWNWYATTAERRLQEGGGVIVMATRWHQDDLIGRLIDRQPGKWKIINFAAIAENDEEFRKAGEPLSCERFSIDTLIGIRDGGVINSFQWSALYQQKPSPTGGGIFKRDDWRFYDASVERHFDEIIQSWDCTFKDSESSDFVSGQVWAYKGSEKFLIDRVNARMSFGGTKTAIRTMSAKHPQSYRKFIEDKANGPAVINDLRQEISGMIAVEPEGGKLARAHAVSGEVEAHNVYLPAEKTPAGALAPLPWVHDFIEQHAGFPTATHDDDVDACTQALAQIRKLSVSLSLVEYLKQQQVKRDVEVEARKTEISTLQKPATNASTETCPKCESTMIVRLAGQKVCNNCGNQWGGPSGIPGGASRKELFK